MEGRLRCPDCGAEAMHARVKTSRGTFWKCAVCGCLWEMALSDLADSDTSGYIER